MSDKVIDVWLETFTMTVIGKVPLTETCVPTVYLEIERFVDA